MVQTSFGFSGRFWPISRPLLQGARRQGEMGFSVVIVVSDAGPVHLSAGSPSTGCDNLPGKHAVAPKTVISRGRSHFARFAVGPPPVSRSHEQLPPQEP